MTGDDVASRKADHLRLAASPDSESRGGAGWGDVHLVHEAMPSQDLDRIDLETSFLDRGLAAPLAIAGMTGGHEMGGEVNAVLARAADRHGLALGVGSQRAALREPELERTFRVVREMAPGAFVIANVGAAQLLAQDGSAALEGKDLATAVEMVRADALAIHLNFLQEAIQPEGDRRVSGLRDALRAATRFSPVPVIAKETGSGLSPGTASELRDLGFAALDVGGLGGTSFAAIESRRAAERGEMGRARLGEVFAEWGIPTPVAVLAAARGGLPVIATGGVRTGLDAARALALGATLVSVGRPALVAAMAGDAELDEWIGQFLAELRLAVFLIGGRGVRDLARAPRSVGGSTRRWLDDLGLGIGPSPSSGDDR